MFDEEPIDFAFRIIGNRCDFLLLYVFLQFAVGLCKVTFWAAFGYLISVDSWMCTSSAKFQL